MILNVIYQTIAPWSSSDACVPIVGSFSNRRGSTWAPWPACSYTASYTTSDDSLCPDTFLLQPTWTFFFFSNLCSSLNNRPCAPMTPLPVQWLSVLRPLLVDSNHYIPRHPHKTGWFRDAQAQSSSHHSLAIVKVSRILSGTWSFFHLKHMIAQTDCSYAASDVFPAS